MPISLVANRQTHLLHVFPTFAVGGSQMRFAQLARIHGPRYRHTVLALDQNYDMTNRLGGLPIAYQELTFDKRKTLESWRKFRALLHSLRPDVLLTYNWGAVEWALLNRFGARTHHVHIEDGFGPEEVRQQLLRRIWARRLALSGTHTRVILPSRNLEKIALSQWSLPPNRVMFVPNGVDCARFAVASRAARNASPLVIGTVASLRREKNIGRLIRAFAALAAQTAPGAVQLMIVGDGAERPALEQLARALAIFDHVRFTGQTSRPEEWYPQMDIFALSSDTEQMPLSVLEAMAAGLPVVATAVGDVAQMVSARNAPYIAAAQDEAFRDALARLAADRPAQRAIGAENERKAREHFDEQVMARRYAEIIG